MVEIGAGWDREAYVAAVEKTGIPSYVGLSYRNASMCSKPNASTGYLWEDVAEKSRLALEFAERCHEGELTRLRPVLYPGHPHTCELAVFERTAEIAWERSWAGDLLVSPTKTDPRPGTTFTTGVQGADRSMRSSYPHTP